VANVFPGHCDCHKTPMVTGHITNNCIGTNFAALNLPAELGVRFENTYRRPSDGTSRNVGN
jgi:hypothetical protein